jgi:hypothetical protein
VTVKRKGGHMNQIQHMNIAHVEERLETFGKLQEGWFEEQEGIPFLHSGLEWTKSVLLSFIKRNQTIDIAIYPTLYGNIIVELDKDFLIGKIIFNLFLQQIQAISYLENGIKTKELIILQTSLEQQDITLSSFFISGK